MSMKAKKHLNFEATHLAMKWNESKVGHLWTLTIPLLTQPYILKHVALLHSPSSLSILHIHFSSLDFSYIFSHFLGKNPFFWVLVWYMQLHPTFHDILTSRERPQPPTFQLEKLKLLFYLIFFGIGVWFYHDKLDEYISRWIGGLTWHDS